MPFSKTWKRGYSEKECQQTDHLGEDKRGVRKYSLILVLYFYFHASFDILNCSKAKLDYCCILIYKRKARHADDIEWFCISRWFLKLMASRRHLVSSKTFEGNEELLNSEVNYYSITGTYCFKFHFVGELAIFLL